LSDRNAVSPLTEGFHTGPGNKQTEI